MRAVIRDFRSDNVQGCPPQILEAIARAAHGTMPSYGRDEITDRVRARCREIFECDLEIFPVVTGTAGNGLALAAMTPPDGAILCHEDAHIERDELGAPEFFTGGAKVVTVPGADGKLHEAELWTAVAAATALAPSASESGGLRHRSPELCLSLTNATEAGTVYTPGELRALTSLGFSGVHLDGARFANALVSLGCSPADLTWRAGIDVVVFGGTKNGLVNAELVIVFRKELASILGAVHHRSGHRPSKMRFISAQFAALFENDLWLQNARHANAMAARLAADLRTIHPVQANVVFTRFTSAQAESLRAEGFEFFEWPIFGEDAYRLVTGFATSAEDVDALNASIRRPSLRTSR